MHTLHLNTFAIARRIFTCTSLFDPIPVLISSLKRSPCPLNARLYWPCNIFCKLGQIEAERREYNDVATLGRSTYAAPQVAMHVHELISLFDAAVLASKEAIPVAHCRFIDVAICPATGIQRYLVRTTCVTDERRTVTRSSSCG